MDGKAVENSEDDFAIAEEAHGRVGVVLAVYQSQTIEQQHDGGSETVVALVDEREAKQSADSKRQKEVENHLPHSFVKSETQLVFF